ncbi:translation initiation factor IF-2 [Paenibacillus sp. FSL H7-0331]|uniref:translation initiation factor IF-2 n=1 Tax=Paenibacillus sp. FSL H7-0331 TaxID=1920421 RepID=UPI00096D8783|nr:translation initiation factor IF-2 [Paenibacillus sp. FSL H7-0331]OMF14650.1 translation initiation factor IF-2 [Paenibacillus sp. FSL H7-0331]
MNKQDNNKDKLRVYEYAKSLNMSSKEIITILKRLDIPVNNHMSVMENDTVSSVEKFFKDVKANAAAKRTSDTGSSSSSTNSAPKETASIKMESKPAPTTQDQAATVSTSSSSTPQGQSSTSAPTAPTTSTTGSGAPRRPDQAGSNRPSQDQNRRPQGQGSQGGSSSYNQRPSSGSSQGSSQGGGYQNRSSQPGGSSSQGGYQNRSSQAGGSSQGGGYQNRSSQGSSSQSGGQSRPAGSGYQGNRSGSAGSTGGSSRPATGTSSASSRPGEQRSPRPATSSADRKPFSSSAPSSFNKSAGAGPQRPSLDNDDNRNKPVKKNTAGPNKRFDDGRSGGSSRGPQNGRGNNRNQQRGKFQEVKKEKIDNTPKKIIVRGTMTVGEMAKSLHKDASEVIKKLLFLGVMATINQELDLDAIQLLAGDYNVEVELKIPVAEDRFETFEEIDDEADLIERPPVVTIMGHVDHGKTTLLDAIRKTSVTEGEAGGITQHIGAYQVETHNKKITFLDTPGHEAFTSMRSRGAQVTDITIIVVAADDGVMPQTIEAIAHAKAAKVPIIVAVNKIDKPDADPEKIKQALTEYELVPEEWGGDTIFCNISAKQRIGLDNLLDTILLVAEVQELKANPNKRARGTVIEAELDKGKGPVVRVLIQHGTLRVGDSFVAGVNFGRVRAMVNDKGKRLKEAGPSTPVEITGLTEVPQAGDPFICFEDERKARIIAEKRSVTLRQSEMGANVRVTLDDLYKHIKDGEIKDLNVIIKGDVQGSVEALRGSLAKIEIEGVRVKILHHGVGAITESDVILASASNAIVIGFNVRPEPQAKNTAESEKVDIRLHSIIYKIIEEIEHAMKGKLDPIFKEVVLGQAEVRQVIKVTKVGVIAGCMITSGKITRNAKMRLIRGGIVVFEGNIDSLKRFKDDVKEVAQGYECGISLEKFNDIKEFDIIEAFIMESVER